MTSDRYRPIAIGVLLALQLALWLALIPGTGLFLKGPNGRTLGADFAVFLAGAQVMKNGGNPYDNRVLYTTERSMMRRQGLLASSNPRLVRAGNPPLFYWLLEPAAGLPFRSTALAWILTMYGLSLAAFLACLRYLGWTRWALPCLIFMLMPQVVLGAAYGNLHALTLVAVVLGLILMRKHPELAGAALALGWLKPQITFPLVLVIFVFHAQHRARLAYGFAATTLLLLVMSIVAVGWRAMGFWFQGLRSWSHVVRLEPNITSLTGLYVGNAPYQAGIALEGFLLVLALAVTAGWWWKVRNELPIPLIGSGWLWVLWFLATPFAHFPDEILLTPPLVALFGERGLFRQGPLPVAALYILFLSLALFSTPLLSLTLVPVGVILWLMRDNEVQTVPTMLPVSAEA